LIQLTFHSNYKAHCEPAMLASGYKAIDDTSASDLERIIQTDPKVYNAIVKSFFKGLGGAFAKVDSDDDFVPTGKAVSGQTPYGQLYDWRVKTMRDAMQKAGIEFR
jgi:hypothetical protein